MFKVKYRLMNDEPLEPGAPAEVEEKKDDVVPMSEFKALQESNKRMEQHMKALLDEKKQADAAAKLAQEEAEQRELENSKKAQNIEEFEQRNNALWQGKMEAKEERISLLELQLETQAKKAAESGLLSKFADESMGALALEKMVHVTLDDDLKPVTEYRNFKGEPITTDKEAFIEYLNNNHASWMRGAESSKRVVEETRLNEKTVKDGGYQNLSMADKVKYLSQKKG